MKKEYIKPTIVVVKLRTSSILTGSAMSVDVSSTDSYNFDEVDHDGWSLN